MNAVAAADTAARGDASAARPGISRTRRNTDSSETTLAKNGKQKRKAEASPPQSRRGEAVDAGDDACDARTAAGAARDARDSSKRHSPVPLAFPTRTPKRRTIANVDGAKHD